VRPRRGIGTPRRDASTRSQERRIRDRVHVPGCARSRRRLVRTYEVLVVLAVVYVSLLRVDPGDGDKTRSTQVTVGRGLPSARQKSTALAPSKSNIIVVHMVMRAARSPLLPAVHNTTRSQSHARSRHYETRESSQL